MSKDGNFSGYGDESFREKEFGHGQERYYGDLQVPGQQPQQQVPPEPQRAPVERPPSGGPSGGRGRTAGLAVAGVAALALIAGGGYWLSTRGGDGATTASTPTSNGTGAASQSAIAPSVSTAAPGSATPTAKNPGFQAYVVAKRGGQFEVPLAFTDEPGTVGWSNPKTKDVIVGSAETLMTGQGYCATSPTRITASAGFFRTSEDPGSAAPFGYERFAKAMTLKDDGVTPAGYPAPTTKQITLGDGKTVAVQSRGTVPFAQSDPCAKYPTDLVVTSFTHPTSNSEVTIIMTRLVGAPKGVETAAFDTMVRSIKPA